MSEPWRNEALREAFDLVESVHDETPRRDETRNALAQLQEVMRAIEIADTVLDLATQ
jgi:hypothetical protein